MSLASQRVHFVGVGGAGMSAIAKVLLEQGARVSGSDLKRSRASAALEALGAEVSIGHDPSLVDGCEIVVVSSAIPDSNVELRRARELGVRVGSRGEALAGLMRNARSIVVAGTHGKTTTTSMIVSILRRAGADPTYLVGGELNDAGTNARLGHGEWIVAESDESDGSFLLLRPHIAVVTNIEADHLDYWSSLAALRGAFERWVMGVQAGGAAVLPAAERELVARARAEGREVISHGGGGDVHACDVLGDRSGSTFTLCSGRERIAARVDVPGALNVDNAIAAAAACIGAGVSLTDIAHGLAAYRGVQRRLQLRGTANGVAVIDDYAHHPTEVRRILTAARAGGYRRVVAVFQPHRYSRTAVLSDDFGSAFDDADNVVVTDVYGAGEQPVPGVTGKLVADAVCTSLPGRSVAYLPHRDELLDYLVRAARPGDGVFTLGAGDITSVGEELLVRLEGSR